MSRSLLNCETPTSAVNSLAEILGIAPNALLNDLSRVEIQPDDRDGDVEQKLAKRFLGDIASKDFSVVWFHGTRLRKIHTLESEGLLPSHMVRSRLREYLISLCDGLERKGSSPSGTSSAFKPQVEGPFGMLCHAAAANPMGYNGPYICAPELVEDIAGALLGENCDALISRFKQETNPHVVHFVGKPTDAVLRQALRYVYETNIEGQDNDESANGATTCFDGGGTIVPPNMILKIERLPSVAANE